MTGQPSWSPADQRWLEATFADLQRQIDELSGQLQALAHVVNVHTVTSLDPEQPTPPPTQERRHGGP